jgi:2-methylcitrate dehydratase PrpD
MTESMPTMGVSMQSDGRDLLAFAHAVSLNDLPADVVDGARACLLDALGCGLFGSGQVWSQILADEMTAEGSAGHSTVIGRQQRLSAPAAALCNGTAIHGFELDDLIAESITHPAACVIPAAIAAAEAVDASGARLLEAIVAGYEVMHRVGLALGVEPARRGFHTTSLVAPLACAVAASKVMELSLEQLLSAVGLACSASSGIKSFAAGHGGGMVKRLHLGRSAEAGVRMAQLASRGFLGPPSGIDSRFGLMEVFGGAGAQPERLSRNLGQGWAMREVWFKVYPICGWIQSVVQLVVQLRGAQPLAPKDVRAIQVGVSRYAAQNNGEAAPVDTMGAQYSIPYCTAVALIGDPRDPAWFRPAAVKDPVTRELAGKVEIVIDPAVEAVYPAQFGASVKLILADGRTSERAVMDCHGTPSDPCGGSEQLDKFRLLAGARLPAVAVAGLARLVDTVASVPVRELTNPLRAGNPVAYQARSRA